MEDGRREGTRSQRSEGRRERERAALAGTGAAFSGLSTFFNARRQLSQSSLSLFLSLARLPSLLSSTYSAPLCFFGFLVRLLHLRRVRHLLLPLRRQTVSSTTYTLSRRNDDISTFSCSSVFQKTVRARDHPASAVWLPRTNAIEFTMQKEWFCATASSDTVACLLSL